MKHHVVKCPMRCRVNLKARHASVQESFALRPQSVGEPVSTRWPKDTFGGSAHDKSLCEADIHEGLVDGGVEGRTGVHVESEVVLKCEGNSNEGACDMRCWM